MSKLKKICSELLETKAGSNPAPSIKLKKLKLIDLTYFWKELKMNADQTNPKVKVKDVKLSKFQNEQIIWIYYEDRTYKAIFI